MKSLKLPEENHAYTFKIFNRKENKYKVMTFIFDGYDGERIRFINRASHTFTTMPKARFSYLCRFNLVSDTVLADQTPKEPPVKQPPIQLKIEEPAKTQDQIDKENSEFWTAKIKELESLDDKRKALIEFKTKLTIAQLIERYQKVATLPNRPEYKVFVGDTVRYLTMY